MPAPPSWPLPSIPRWFPPRGCRLDLGKGSEVKKPGSLVWLEQESVWSVLDVSATVDDTVRLGMEWEVMQRLLSRFFSVFSGSSAKVFLLLVLAVADASIPLHIATLLLPLPLLLLLGALPNPKLSFQSPLSLKFSISVSPKQESKPPSYVIVVHIHINILNRSMLLPPEPSLLKIDDLSLL